MVLLSASWFVNDGYRKDRCEICGGSGDEPDEYNVWPGHLAFLAEANKRIAEWGRLKPRRPTT
jgi:hypothetical protein